MVWLFLAATLSAGNAEFEANAAVSARDIAIRRLQTETVEKGLRSGVLEEAMRADPKASARTNDAVRLCRKVYAEALARQYRAAADEIVRQLGLEAAPTNGEAEVVSKAARARFAAAYARERAAVVAEQARKIAGTVRPTESELETEDEATLRREMTAKIAAGQKEPVFEENRAYISERIVDPILADGRREMKRQREYLSRTKCEAYAPEAMKREIEANLRRNVAERQAKERDPAKAWGVFPGVVRETLPKVVERRVTGLVAKEVDAVAFAVDDKFVRETMAADPSSHLKVSDSEKVFRRIYAAKLAALAIERAAAAAPMNERVAFATAVKAHATAPELTKSIEARLRHDVLPAWREVRAEVARDEANRLWPTLADCTWYPEPALADRIVARSDYTAAVRAWRKVPELTDLSLSGGDRPHLEETDAAADRSVAAAFDLARNAIAAQNALVTDVAPSVLAEAKARKESFWRRTPDLQTVIGLLTDAVTEHWDAQRVATLWPKAATRPANAAEQHAELFPSVRTRIELVARAILEKMDESEEKKTAIEQPETPPPTGYSIVVECTGENVSVKLEQGGKTVAERQSKAKMSDYRGAMKFISDKLGTDILKLK